ncbi:hypothetical protein [Burkholderia oklahomensis]|uniref:Uncharacterized protein n=1 Tax=Burkholderia oklahomensis TaxID=342113 RepID=A0AAI8B873_9BURK|nr:hypothetical protein [Burkholderia oklahomensis]AIO67468.1 hypothetical protein DM82_1376 [Burkholderia oklahomensis]AOI42360.1 hypothetical protein WG70_22455 [Burkholderia oklahomensis EO147]KUY52712.1 hypothetical protein WG70_00445 [Burkholderia oklahomensis EO147]MDN7675611.1 hypothetical protein [Burkholderia oklahomensis]QPS37099.1 hypothetical protein I6G57_17800 [Burkholderia oklahomensis]
MKKVLDRIRAKKETLADHPFFPQLANVTVPEIKELMRTWAPLLIHFAMTFRDINRMYYHYKKPADKLQRAINEHVDVDSSHWQLMVADLKTLDTNDKASDCESAIKLIWDDTGEPVREYMYSVMARARRCGDCPLLRMAAMEAGEATSKIFFTTSRRIAAAYEADTGDRLRYLGAEHIDSEMDHPIDSSVFLEQPLSNEKRAEAISLVDEHFSSFRAFLDYKYEINRLALTDRHFEHSPG